MDIYRLTVALSNFGGVAWSCASMSMLRSGLGEWCWSKCRQTRPGDDHRVTSRPKQTNNWLIVRITLLML